MIHVRDLQGTHLLGSRAGCAEKDATAPWDLPLAVLIGSDTRLDAGCTAAMQAGGSLSLTELES